MISGSLIYAVRGGAFTASVAGAVPRTEFASCVTKRNYQAQIQQDRQTAETAGVGGTPATFVNGFFINGAQPWSVFKQAIEDALAGKKKTPATGDPKAPDISGRDVVLGEQNAPVTLIEYGDYQCPFCARYFMEVEPLLREEYIKTGKVKMVFRNYPFLGPESVSAAEAAECAKDQGQFWAFHDALYNAEHQDGREHNGNLNNDLFFKLAKDLKLK